MTSAQQLSEGPPRRPARAVHLVAVPPEPALRAARPMPPAGAAPVRRDAPAAPAPARCGGVRPRTRVVPGGARAGARSARGGCGPVEPMGGRRLPGGERPAPPLRLTRRGRRLIAGLSIATGLGIAVLAAGLLADGGTGGLRLVGDSDVVVRSGDTLWGIAVDVAPEEDTRAVVHAIVEVNDLESVHLVPGQVLQLP